MSVQAELHQMKLNEWINKLADQKASGLTVREWCKLNNLTIHKYNYWKHLIKEEAAKQVLPDIVPVDFHTELPIIQSNLSSNPIFNSSSSANCAIRATHATSVSLSMNGM